MRTIKLTGGDLGSEESLYRCDLAQAAAPVEYLDKEGEWHSTQYQCADCRHYVEGLIAIAKQLEAGFNERSEDDFDCDGELIDDDEAEQIATRLADEMLYD